MYMWGMQALAPLLMVVNMCKYDLDHLMIICSRCKQTRGFVWRNVCMTLAWRRMPMHRKYCPNSKPHSLKDVIQYRQSSNICDIEYTQSSNSCDMEYPQSSNICDIDYPHRLQTFVTWNINSLQTYIMTYSIQSSIIYDIEYPNFKHLWHSVFKHLWHI